MSQLLKLAKERFAADWTDADEIMFTQTALGKEAHYGDGVPPEGDKRDKKRVLQADRIEWLCTDPEATTAVTHRGVQIKGARIEGELDLSYAKIEFPLFIVNSAIPRGMFMQRGQLYALFLSGTHTGPINADGLRVEHDLHMRNGFHASGEVRLLDATIGGTLDCSNSHFSNQQQVALHADRIDVKGSVFLDNKFKAHGEVRLLGATIGDDLVCENGRFSNPNGKALTADRIDVKGHILLQGEFKAEGTVRLLNATIGGNLYCESSHFSNPDGHTLYADTIVVKGSVFLRNEFKSEGTVRLRGATIGGNLECANSCFSKVDGDALDAPDIDVGGSVFLRKQFRADGDVEFRRASVGGSFEWRGVQDSDQCTLRLEFAKIGTLWDEEESWPAKLYLDGLVYDRLHSDAPTLSDARLRWLGRQGYEEDKFVPQPYVQLAKVLQEMGHEADARRILIAKQKDPARLAMMSWYHRLWHYLLGVTIGYGYRPWRALLWIVGFIVLGAFLFQSGSDTTQFEKTIDGAPPAFNTWVYSLDAFVPLIDLHQAKYRLPKGGGLRAYLWFHIGFGWLLTTLLVVGLTGLVRK